MIVSLDFNRCNKKVADFISATLIFYYAFAGRALLFLKEK